MPILNEREYRRAKARLERLQASLQAPSFLEAIRVGFSAEVIELQRSAVQKRISTLEDAISQYESLRNRNSFDGESTEIDDLGLLPVFGRIARGLSQRELAEALGMKEQHISKSSKLPWNFESRLFAAKLRICSNQSSRAKAHCYFPGGTI